VKATVQKFVDKELAKLWGAHFPEYPQCSGSQAKDDVGKGDDEEALDEEEEQQRKSAIKGVGKITLLCMMRMKEDEMAHTLKSGKTLGYENVKKRSKTFSYLEYNFH
jgi:hypothetical protein